MSKAKEYGEDVQEVLEEYWKKDREEYGMYRESSKEFTEAVKTYQGDDLANAINMAEKEGLIETVFAMSSSIDAMGLSLEDLKKSIYEVVYEVI